MKFFLTGILTFISLTVIGKGGLNYETWQYWVVFVSITALTLVQYID